MTYTSNLVKQQRQFLSTYNSPKRQINNTLISNSIKRVSKKFISLNSLNSFIDFENSDLKEHKLKFKKIYTLIIQGDEGALFLKDEDLEIVAYGMNVEEIKEKVINDLVFNWQEYVVPDISELDEGAKRLRSSMIELLEENHEF